VTWRDGPDWEGDEPRVVTHGHAQAVMWGALAVVLLAVAGVLFSLLQ
jgi:hypothetical protein